MHKNSTWGGADRVASYRGQTGENVREVRSVDRLKVAVIGHARLHVYRTAVS